MVLQASVHLLMAAVAGISGAVALDVEGDAGACQVQDEVRLALRGRGIELTADASERAHLVIDGKSWRLRWHERERSLGEVVCTEGAWLVAAIMSGTAVEPKPASAQAPPVARSEPDAGVKQPSARPIGIGHTGLAERRSDGPMDGPREAPEPKSAEAHADNSPQERAQPPAPEPSAPLRSMPVDPEPPKVSNASLQTGSASGSISKAPVEGERRKIVPRIGVAAGAWITSEPRLSPALVLHLGIRFDHWFLGVRPQAAWPDARTVDVDGSTRGTLQSAALGVSAVAGRCFGQTLKFCPGLTAGARFLFASASAEGRLYRPTSSWGALASLGLELASMWQLRPDFGVVLQVAPMIPLGSLSAGVEGTSAQVQVGAEGVVSVGCTWTPGGK